MLAKVCDDGLAGGFQNGDNACRVEAEQHLKWLNSRDVKLFIEEGKPKPGTAGASRFLSRLASDTTYQLHKTRLRKITPYACNMGSSDACKLIEDNPTRFRVAP